ncbi:MAG: MBL fold metallo-hydrolase [Desulfobulbaceae bacterium]|nr:MAG: MBL fold metallo-hydrolase [Desulfobulbaceae bacterium]
MQITPKIHAVKIPFEIPVSAETKLERFVYAYTISSDVLVLIDSGVAGAKKVIFRALEKQGRNPSEIDVLLLTHSHPDHIGGASGIKNISNCKIWSHPDARAWVENVDKQFSDRPVPGFHALVEGSVSIERELNDLEVVELGDTSLQVIYTPGHSRCSLSLFCEESGVLFTGDAIPQGNDLPIYDDVGLAVQSIKRLKGIVDVQHILSSWSDPSLDENPEEVMDGGLQYFQRIHTVVRQVMHAKQVVEPMDLCREVVGILGLPELAINPLVAKSLFSHKRFIEKEFIHS